MSDQDQRHNAQRQLQDEAKRGRRSETDPEHTYAVTTVTERISLTPKGERIADLILSGRQP
jgi:hypothetical protein